MQGTDERPEKKPYQTPRLLVFGKLGELTQQGVPGTRNDGMPSKTG
jgi:hypothetical protein